MVAAIVGSRKLRSQHLEELIGTDFSQIISGGAMGIDRSARNYAEKHHIQILEILPDYDLYGKAAPLKRNDCIVRLSDVVFIFWDGKSHGSNYMIEQCRKLNKPMKLFIFENGSFIPVDEIPLSPVHPDYLFKRFVPTIIYE